MNLNDRNAHISDLKKEMERISMRVDRELADLRARVLELEQNGEILEPPGQASHVMPPPLPQVTKEVKPVAAQISPPARIAPIAPKPGVEQQLGRVWLVRIGIGALLTGLVLAANYAYQSWIRDFPAGVRLALLFLLAGGMIEAGRRLAQRENLRNYGDVVLAGGLAFFYFCVYAAHGVARLRVIESPVLGAVMLAFAAGVIGWVSWIRQAKITALLAVVFASYAVMVQPMGWLAGFSGLLMAGCGGWMMMRKGWQGPGWTSMICSYVSFAGWQWFGAAGGGSAVAQLWFLPLLWAIFAMPGIFGRFAAMENLRERAWFAGLNNGLFFCAFSVMWGIQQAWENYWLVCAVAGMVFAVCGYYARKNNDGTSEPFIGQGLSCLTAALAMKLDSWHLGTALALESVLLAWMFRRYHRRMEWWLALVVGLIAAAWIYFHQYPVWGAGLAAVFFVGAGAGMRRERDRESLLAPGYSLFGAKFFLALAGLVGLGGWLWKLPGSDQLPSALAVYAACMMWVFFGDRRRWWPDVGFLGLAFLIAAIWSAVIHSGSPQTHAVAAVLGGLGLVVLRYGRTVRPGKLEGEIGVDSLHPLPGWLTAAICWLVLVKIPRGLDLPLETNLMALGGMAVGLAVLAGLLRCGMFLPVAAAVLASALWPVIWELPGGNELFYLAGIGAVLLIAVFVPALRRHAETGEWTFAMVITRAAMLVFWLVAWHLRRPDDVGDWYALSALAILLACRGGRWRLPPEFFVIVAIALNWQVTCWIGVYGNGQVYAGWAVALLFLVWLFGGRRGGREAKPEIEAFLAAAGTVVVAAWLTRVTQLHFGWKPMAIVWTLLGGAQVAIGLLRQMRSVRVGGFILLAVAIGKLFVVDVWDFETVWRFVTFIVLGIALLALGLYYHRIMPEVKSFFRDEGGEGKSDG